MPHTLYAQQAITAPEQDCINALPVCDSVFVQTNAYRGVGQVNELNGASCIGVERNAVWYKITVGADGFLGFMIEPLRQRDDYDWAVYRLPFGGSCADIGSGQAIEVSCNFSDGSKFPVLAGRTGANGGSTETRQGSRGSPFNDRIPVKAGETYYLVITNFSASNAGYRLSFGVSSAGVIGTADPAPPKLAAATVGEQAGGAGGGCSISSINAIFSKYVRCASVQPSDFVLSGADGVHTITTIESSRCATSANNFDSAYTLTVAPPVSESGTYTLALAGVVTDLCGNSVMTGSTKFTVNFPSFRPTVFGAREFCAGGTTTLDAGGGFVSYRWVNSVDSSKVISTEQTITVKEPGTYTVNVRDKSGCAGAESVTARLRTEPIAPVISGTLFVCANGSTVLDAGQGFTSYDWSNGAKTRTITVTQPAAYSVTVRDAGNCSGTSTATVRLSNGLIVSIRGQTQFCAGGGAFMDAGTVDGTGIEFSQYQWLFGGIEIQGSEGKGRFFTARQPGQYAVRVAVNGCTGESSAINIVQNQLPPKPTITLHGNILTAPESAGYQWKNASGTPISGATSRDFSPLISGGYILTVVNAAGCEASSDVLAFQRINAEAAFAVGSDSAKPGGLVEIPIVLSKAARLMESGATGFVVTLKFNARLLIPEPNQTGVSDRVANNERFVRVALPIQPIQPLPSDMPGTIARLRFTAMLGNTTATALELVDLVSIPPNAVMVGVGGVSGTFTLTGVSTEGSIRLIDGFAKIVLTSTPNPVSDALTLTYSLPQPEQISITLVDAMGKAVTAAPLLAQTVLSAGTHALTVKTSDLPPGAYFVLLQTPTYSVTQPIMVMR